MTSVEYWWGIGRRVTWRSTSGYSFFSVVFFVGDILLGLTWDPLWLDLTLLGVPCREGAGDILRRCCGDEGRQGGGVVSICIARTDEGLRKGERTFTGV